MLTASQTSIVPYLPEVLDGLFPMLGDGQSIVRDATEVVLGQFLERLQQDQPEDEASCAIGILHYRIK
ncbi:unnamed protein product [Toxocara canis]|uniref:Importin-11 n=1 Tax=Toxocara canis TaxID=6265 RepID=A0A183U926_TOXCA|nr:unnamed protein product [Toxocara canis]